MHFDADTKAEYKAAFAAFLSGTIAGQHSVGELSIAVSTSGAYTLSDDNGNQWSGRCRSGAMVGQKLQQAFERWLVIRNIQ